MNTGNMASQSEHTSGTSVGVGETRIVTEPLEAQCRRMTLRAKNSRENKEDPPML